MEKTIQIFPYLCDITKMSGSDLWKKFIERLNAALDSKGIDLKPFDWTVDELVYLESRGQDEDYRNRMFDQHAPEARFHLLAKAAEVCIRFFSKDGKRLEKEFCNQNTKKIDLVKNGKGIFERKSEKKIVSIMTPSPKCTYHQMNLLFFFNLDRNKVYLIYAGQLSLERLDAFAKWMVFIRLYPSSDRFCFQIVQKMVPFAGSDASHMKCISIYGYIVWWNDRQKMPTLTIVHAFEDSSGDNSSQLLDWDVEVRAALLEWKGEEMNEFLEFRLIHHPIGTLYRVKRLIRVSDEVILQKERMLLQ